MKHVPESNGRVGILGISYDGFLPLMALVHASFIELPLVTPP